MPSSCISERDPGQVNSWLVILALRFATSLVLLMLLNYREVLFPTICGPKYQCTKLLRKCGLWLVAGQIICYSKRIIYFKNDHCRLLWCLFWHFPFHSSELENIWSSIWSTNSKNCVVAWSTHVWNLDMQNQLIYDQNWAKTMMHNLFI